MKLLINKTAVITGASRGIGAAIALKLAENGANIIITYINDSSKEKVQNLCQQIQAFNVRVLAFQTDASHHSAAEIFIQNVLKEFNTIDICVNNAGISKDNLLLRTQIDQWNEVIQTNLTSVFNITKQVIRPMMKQKNGSIINISSIIGERGNAGQSSYAASKAGIVGFTKSIALEFGSRNIRCNAVAPGFIETDMTQYLKNGDGINQFLNKIPLGKLGAAEDVANTVLFLASNLSSYITGQVINVCGGLNI